MELADESLDRVLPRRSLTPVEVRDLLPPTLDALRFLHRKGLVQGQLKPPNILGVGDHLKLASDSIRPSFATAARIRRPSLYDPPEAKRGRMSAAGDMWALGITLVEALTQQTPQITDEGLPGETACLPAAIPRDFEGTLRQCLSRYPGNRPTAAEIEPQLRLQPRAQ
jgi:serine/threonine protein kinase